MKGRCLCETMEHEIVQLDSPIAHCACRPCRNAHAAAFNTTPAVSRDHFNWRKGQETLKFHESSPGKRRYSCPNCGSHLVAERIGQPDLILRVATLDDDPGKTPRARSGSRMKGPGLNTDFKSRPFRNGHRGVEYA